MAPDADESGTDRVPAGKCPNHGKVSGDEVNFRFPTRAKCADCGSDLETAGLVERQLVTDGGQHEAEAHQRVRAYKMGEAIRRAVEENAPKASPDTEVTRLNEF